MWWCIMHPTGKAPRRLWRRFERAGAKAVAVQGDLSKPDEVAKVFQAAGDAFGKIDVLVNNAGAYEFRPVRR